nr:MAG TPA: hypothetical protein [Caudoviricetes sp.]
MLLESKQRKRGIGGVLEKYTPSQIAPVFDFSPEGKLRIGF